MHQIYLTEGPEVDKQVAREMGVEYDSSFRPSTDMESAQKVLDFLGVTKYEKHETSYIPGATSKKPDPGLPERGSKITGPDGKEYTVMDTVLRGGGRTPQGYKIEFEYQGRKVIGYGGSLPLAICWSLVHGVKMRQVKPE